MTEWSRLKPPAHVDTSRPERRRFAIRLVAIALLLGLFSFAFLDQPAGKWFSARPIQKDLDELGEVLDVSEHFGTPYGQGLILLTLAVVLAWRSAIGARIFVGACGAGLAADFVKLLIARVRPRSLDFISLDAWHSFSHAFPLGFGGSGVQSFPSAHTASAFGFAALMSWAFPTGRWAFLCLATLTGLQRIGAGAHFPSDVCCGAALGWWVGTAFIDWPVLDNAIRRLEAEWLRRLARRSSVGNEVASSESAKFSDDVATCETPQAAQNRSEQLSDAA